VHFALYSESYLIYEHAVWSDLIEC
jgi:hypothetical protein